jgi:hypothetical protein
MAAVIHELREMFGVLVAGISFAEIDRFDQDFERMVQVSDHPGIYREPGDDPTSPYFLQHQAATIAERLFIEDVADNWQDYEKEVGDL